MRQFFKTLLAAFLGTLIALGTCFFLLIGMIAAFSASETVTVPTSAILKLDFSDPIEEQGRDEIVNFSSMDLAGTNSIGILKVLNSIQAAAEDPAIKFIYLNPGEMNIGMAQLEEIRDAFVRFRQCGKPVIAYCDNYSQAGYYLCSVADKIYMNREGMGGMVGLSANIMFFKNILDKIGINVQLIRHGKFKSAAEQFVQQDISNANRLQNQEMLNSVWSSWTEAICQSRGIDPDEFNRWVDNLQLTLPSTWVEKGLVDKIVTRGEMTDILCNLASVDSEKELMFVSVRRYAEARLTENYRIRDKVAVIYADGEITMDGTEGIAANRFYPIIKKVTDDSSVKAVVLRVNSPGGDAQAADIINEALQDLREEKPLIVSFANYAASGGYWIAAQSDHIFTDETTITGSIGVFSLFMTYGDALKKQLDINTVNISTNSHSDMLLGMRKLDNAETAAMQDMVENVYGKFINLVSDGRNINVAQVDSIGQGRVWTGSQALLINLADSKGGILDAIEYAKSAAGLDEARVVEYPAPKNQLDKIMEMLNGSASAAKIVTDPVSAVEKAYSYLKGQKNSFTTLARLPYIYEIE